MNLQYSKHCERKQNKTRKKKKRQGLSFINSYQRNTQTVAPKIYLGIPQEFTKHLFRDLLPDASCCKRQQISIRYCHCCQTKSLFLTERIKITYHIISFQFSFPLQSSPVSAEVELLLIVYLLIFKIIPIKTRFPPFIIPNNIKGGLHQ